MDAAPAGLQCPGAMVKIILSWLIVPLGLALPMVLHPSWPGLARAADHATDMETIAATPIEDVANDPRLRATALAAGRATFAADCAPCHGAGGEGRVGVPSLADGAWLWGGRLADIETTIRHGIRSGDPDARAGAMPKFGVDGLLTSDQIGQVADYVTTLFGAAAAGPDVAAGRAIFAMNCAACHGANGEGNRDAGGPRLTGAAHLYGGTRESVVAQVTNPRLGVMPNWAGRLDKATIRAVALYVHALGGGE
jgi:cytochrome c oxidase cbb3-type subunit 3